MAGVIYRGSTPTIYIRPVNGMQVSDLGEPAVAISQDVAFLTPEVTVDSANNRLIVALTESETLSLTEDVDTFIQAVYKTQSGDIYRFPIHKLSVASTLIEEFDSAEEVE